MGYDTFLFSSISFNYKFLSSRLQGVSWGIDHLSLKGTKDFNDRLTFAVQHFERVHFIQFIRTRLLFFPIIVFFL